MLKEFKGYGKLLFVLLISLLLFACSEKTKEEPEKVVKDPEVTDVVDDFVPADVAPGTLGKDEYDYSLFVKEDKAKFYETNQIYLGEETQQDEEKYLVYFYSPVCVYCNQFYDTLVQYEALDNAYTIYKINVDIKENIGAWEKFKLQGTPTLMLFNTTTKSVEDKIIGLTSLDTIPQKENVSGK